MTTKPETLEPFFELAIDNITSFGDTDIFPLPFENNVLFDRKATFVKILCDTFADFDEQFSTDPPQNIRSLSPVGHSGFRWAAQIDPFWNTYFFGLVLSIAELIEKNRIPTENNCVFSYRLNLDFKSGKIFKEKIGFREFLRHSREMAQKHKYVVITDIADCYSRISHHQIENALQQIDASPDIAAQLLDFLQDYSNEKSYGLPIGGQSARILVELALGLTDNLLKQNGFSFCRFTDDYHIFVDSEADAYRALIFLSEKLARNEALALQKSKTRVMSAKEFISTPDVFSIEEDPDSSHPIKGLLNISLKYDPYSPTADEDYEALREEIEKIDLLHLLNLEFAKSRIHANFTRRIVGAIRHASDGVKNDAALTLLENLSSLYSIFPSVAITIRSIFTELDDSVQHKICEFLCKLVREGNSLVMSEVYLAFVVRILGLKKTSENIDTLVSIHNSIPNPLLRKDIILIMANWENYAWLYDVKNTFSGLPQWERRAFIAASYKMGDSGKHWRTNHKDKFSIFELQIKEWAAESKQKKGDSWRIPL